MGRLDKVVPRVCDLKQFRGPLLQTQSFPQMGQTGQTLVPIQPIGLMLRNRLHIAQAEMRLEFRALVKVVQHWLEQKILRTDCEVCGFCAESLIFASVVSFCH